MCLIFLVKVNGHMRSPEVKHQTTCNKRAIQGVADLMPRYPFASQFLTSVADICYFI